MKRSISLCIRLSVGAVVLMFGAGVCSAQGWTTISTDNKDFSLAVPTGYVVDIKTDGKTVYAFADGASLTV